MNSPEENTRLVTVHLATSDFEAQTVAAILRDREIDVAVFSTAIQAFGCGDRMLGGIPVQVRSEDLERAKAALRSNKFLADSVDWDSVDVGEEDESAKQLGKSGGMNTFGRFMVGGGRIAALIILVLSAAIWLARCS
ncbi:MAG: hypothetical protein O2875_02130 [Planctomycetota bacterium]|nr:hypothetical protein [Planctomycetota bacterium]MDA1262474.1 hypothetical protein [Planctomycetota bacterium]